MSSFDWTVIAATGDSRSMKTTRQSLATISARHWAIASGAPMFAQAFASRAECHIHGLSPGYLRFAQPTATFATEQPASVSPSLS